MPREASSLSGLTKIGNFKLPWPRDSFAAGNDDEIRHVDAMVAENFFRYAFVLAKRESGGAASGEWQPLQREK